MLEWGKIIVGSIVILCIALLVKGSIWVFGKGVEKEKWFAGHCQVVRIQEADIVFSVGDKGSLTTFIPEKKTYKCDDGKEYVR